MSLASEHYDLELGLGHWLTWCWWKPDIELNPEYKDFPNEEKIGGIITHEMPNGKICEGSFWLESEIVRRFFGNHATWKVESWEPLTCSPSFLCHCGDHGYIRNGKWVEA